MMRILFLIILTCSLRGQILLPILAGKPPAGATYTGPGDVTSGASAWWGLRAYSAATRGNKAANVCDASDVHCADALTDAITGALIIPSSNPNCGGSACTVKTLYDQTGGTNCASIACDLTQATIALRPALTTSCIGSLPCLTFAAGQIMQTVNTFTSSQPISVSAVTERTSGFTSYQAIVAQAVGGLIQFDFNNTANTALMYAGTLFTATANDSAFHAMQGMYTSGSGCKFYIDGTLSTGTCGTGTAIDPLIMGLSSGNQLLGNVTEAGWWLSDTSSNFSTMNSNQHTYWGF